MTLLFRSPRLWAALIALCVCFSLGANAQILTGTLTGAVQDETQAVIPGATVTAVDTRTNRAFTTKTDSSGNFSLPNLPHGEYRVIIEAEGFARYIVERVQVQTGQLSRVIAVMKVAPVGEEIVVSEQTQTVVETESVELKFTVDRAQILNLPLPTRNPLDLARTLPGIVTPTSSGIADAFVHGLRGNSVNLRQDGIDVADNFVKTSGFFAISAPTVESIGEFSVTTSGVGVDAGFGAAQVSMRTERGSNEFHGSLFWFQRTNAFNANTFFNNAAGVPRPFQLQNRIGARAGGPVYIPKLYDGRDRTWLFGSYEAFREPLSRSRTRTVMTDTARQGLFTYRRTSDGVLQTVNLLSQAQFPNIPITTINQQVMGFYNSLVPTTGLTNSGCTNDGINIRCFTFNLPGRSEVDRYTLRADHQITRNHTIEFVYNHADFSSIPDLLNGIEPQFPGARGGGQTSRRQVVSWALHSMFGTSMTNEFRVGFQRAPVQFALFEDYSETGGVQVAFAGVTSPVLTQTNLPQGRNTPVVQVSDNFNWAKGRHLIRFGGEWKHVSAESFFYNTVVPRVILGSNSANPHGIVAANFPGGISSGDLARAQNIYINLVGLMGSVTQGFNHTSADSGFVPGVPRLLDPTQHFLSFYIQDQWKIRPNVTITGGVRYEFHGVFDMRSGLILGPKDGTAGVWGPAGLNNLFNPVTTPAMTDVLLDFTGGRNGRPLYDRDINNFAPFLGFAWDPWSNGKTSIRGGVTLNYTQDGFTLFQLPSTNNLGLFTTVSNTTPTGGFSTSNPQLPPAPVASFPVSQRANFIANTGANLVHFDSNLATPYVVGWHLAVERELWSRTSLAIRYVGNRAMKLLRFTDINEIDLLNNPYSSSVGRVANILTEFRNAQTNLAISIANGAGNNFSNQGLPGQVPLPIFQALFQGVSTASGFGNATFITQLQENQIGAMFDTLRRSNTYRVNRETFFPLNFFVANPWANLALLSENSSWSYYHGLELEANRRFAQGIFFGFNYTFGKVLTDQRFLTSQTEFQSYRSLRNRGLDRNRAPFDVTHTISANAIYELPFGRGKWLASGVHPGLDKIIGGWSLQTFIRWNTGAPFTLWSGRNTTGALIGQPAVLRNITPKQLQKYIGTFKTPNGVFWLNPNSGLLNISGSTSTAVLCTPGQTTPCFAHPGAGEEGNAPYFGLNAPSFWNVDFSVIKRTSIPSISERFNLEIRFEGFNALNHPNFVTLVGSNQSGSIASPTFGQMTGQADTVRGGGVNSRLIQWAIRVNW